MVGAVVLVVEMVVVIVVVAVVTSHKNFWWWRNDDVFVMVEVVKNPGMELRSLFPVLTAGATKSTAGALDCEYCLQSSLVRQHSRGLALEKGTSYINAIS